MDNVQELNQKALSGLKEQFVLWFFVFNHSLDSLLVLIRYDRIAFQKEDS